MLSLAACSSGWPLLRQPPGGAPAGPEPAGFARVVLHANSTRLLDPLAEGVAKKCVCVCVCVCRHICRSSPALLMRCQSQVDKDKKDDKKDKKDDKKDKKDDKKDLNTTVRACDQRVFHQICRPHTPFQWA